MRPRMVLDGKPPLDVALATCGRRPERAGTDSLSRWRLMAQLTDRVLTCYRIGDPAGTFPIYNS